MYAFLNLGCIFFKVEIICKTVCKHSHAANIRLMIRAPEELQRLPSSASINPFIWKGLQRRLWTVVKFTHPKSSILWYASGAPRGGSVLFCSSSSAGTFLSWFSLQKQIYSCFYWSLEDLLWFYLFPLEYQTTHSVGNILKHFIRLHNFIILSLFSLKKKINWSDT